MEARLATSPGLRVISRDTAFANVLNAGTRFGQANFDVSRDGSRIVSPELGVRDLPAGRRAELADRAAPAAAGGRAVAALRA